MVVILGCSGKCVVVNWRPLLRIRSREFDVLVVRTRRRVKRLARARVVVAWLARRHDEFDGGADVVVKRALGGSVLIGANWKVPSLVTKRTLVG